ncbi:MAG: hypothetical protein RBT71_13450, partial [Flavobacteriales bacterium]|nr:hypothetical protein [Flavobacteriales bacterium]
MERPEHGPADIERLLRAYPFDELPEADRARVLLHVDGRAEYEAMRALLLGVERGAGRLPAIAPEESVRINVMAAFREAHAARRGPWLNGLLAVLWPQELRHAWRPALALGTLALLVVGGIVAVR